MKLILLFIPFLIISCNNSKPKSKSIVSKVEAVSTEKATSNVEIDSKSKMTKNDSLNNIIANWNQKEKKLDFVEQTGIKDSVILLNHYKYYSDDYMDYCYSIIAFKSNSKLHNHKNNPFDKAEMYFEFEEISDSLKYEVVIEEINNIWCELFKYENLICTSDDRLKDINLDSCYFMIRYMDGLYAKPIAKVESKENNSVEILMYNKQSITNEIFDSLKIYYVGESKDVAIFQESKYNYKEKKYYSNYSLYATKEYCMNLPVLAKIETEYDICENKGIEYGFNWKDYLTKLDSLKIMLDNSIIIKTESN